MGTFLKTLDICYGAALLILYQDVNLHQASGGAKNKFRLASSLVGLGGHGGAGQEGDSQD
jgi:hypothetical protein